jgi:hypothetical protein
LVDRGNSGALSLRPWARLDDLAFRSTKMRLSKTLCVLWIGKLTETSVEPDLSVDNALSEAIIATSVDFAWQVDGSNEGRGSSSVVCSAIAPRTTGRKGLRKTRHIRRPHMHNTMPDDFSLDVYGELLTAISRHGYAFGVCDEVSTLLASGKPFVLLRHDVEIDLAAAISIAKLEATLGIRATYCLTPSTPFYSLFSRQNLARVRQLQSLGHQVGLHTESTGSMREHDPFLANPELFSSLIPGASRDIVSIHSPDSLNAIPLQRYPVLSTIYKPLIDGTVDYISDSGGRWQHHSPLKSDAVRLRRPIHLLTHPVWWMYAGSNPWEKLVAALASLAEERHASIHEFLPKLARRYNVMAPDTAAVDDCSE